MRTGMSNYLVPMSVFLLVLIIISISLFRPVVRKIRFSLVYTSTYLILAIAVYLITLGAGRAPGQGFMWSMLFILGFPATLETDHVVRILNLTKYTYLAAPVLGIIQYFIIGSVIDFIAMITVREPKKTGVK